MFSSCESLKTIDLSGFNTENVENMKGMFYYCLNLEKINVSTFNTSKVIDMSGMFNICPNLLNIDLSSFDIRDETNIDGMFPPMNVCVAPPFNSPAFNMHIIDAPQKVKVNEKSYDKFLKILDKEKIYK
jgi:surface protein